MCHRGQVLLLDVPALLRCHTVSCGGMVQLTAHLQRPPSWSILNTKVSCSCNDDILCREVEPDNNEESCSCSDYISCREVEPDHNEESCSCSDYISCREVEPDRNEESCSCSDAEKLNLTAMTHPLRAIEYVNKCPAVAMTHHLNAKKLNLLFQLQR